MIELNEHEVEFVGGADMDEVYIVAAATVVGGLVGGPALAASVLIHGLAWAAVN